MRESVCVFVREKEKVTSCSSTLLSFLAERNNSMALVSSARLSRLSQSWSNTENHTASAHTHTHSESNKEREVDFYVSMQSVKYSQSSAFPWCLQILATQLIISDRSMCPSPLMSTTLNRSPQISAGNGGSHID